MIKYQLLCDAEHEFEGWFRDSADFDAQSEQGLIECPACGSSDVRKAIMAPAVARGGAGREARRARMRSDVMEAMARARDYVERNFDYVGDKFPEEARKIHYGETDERPIYGEATRKEARDLVDEGVAVTPLPAAKPKTDKAGAPKPAPAPSKKTN